MKTMKNKMTTTMAGLKLSSMMITIPKKLMKKKRRRMIIQTSVL